MGARNLGRIADVLVGWRRRSGSKRPKVVIGGSLGSAGRISRHETPDGREIVVAFHLPRRVWRAKEIGNTSVYEAPRLRNAVADATGDAPDSSLIRTLEAEVTAAYGIASE